MRTPNAAIVSVSMVEAHVGMGQPSLADRINERIRYGRDNGKACVSVQALSEHRALLSFVEVAPDV